MRRISMVLVSVLALGGIYMAERSPEPADVRLPDAAWELGYAVAGNPETLIAKYERWKQMLVDAEPVLVVGLSWSKGLSTAKIAASGSASIDLVEGTISVRLQKLPETGEYDVWLVDNSSGPGRSVRPETGDRLVRLGSLQRDDDDHSKAALTTRLDSDELHGFQLDMIAVTSSGGSPDGELLFYGSPDLFQRLYVAELSGAIRDEESGSDPAPQQLAVALAPVAPSDKGSFSTLGAVADACVRMGQAVFFVQEFEGNGRRCGTCHPSTNNFTIDPEFIGQLPDDDPLFVAEFEEFEDTLGPGNPWNRKFEIPALMRSDGLILENVDGFPSLTFGGDRFVMRSVPHLLGLTTSMLPQGNIDEIDDALGWGGDGSPVEAGLGTTGSLRDFAIGAVRQHFTTSLERQIGVHFRLPTEEELDALECFQRSLGRTEDPDLDAITFTASSAEDGKETFLDSDCHACHANAGATAISIDGAVNGKNAQFRTGVELRLQNRIFFDPDRFPDGGFGADACTGPGFNATGCPQIPLLSPPQAQNCNATPPVFIDFGQGCFPTLNGSFGDHSFNTPSLIEVADTAPFFHNNLDVELGVDEPLEESIRFYATSEFADFRGGGGIQFDEQEVDDVANLLRVLNSMDNIENAAAPPLELAIERLRGGPLLTTSVNPLLELAARNLRDAQVVLSEGEQNGLSFPSPVLDRVKAAVDLIVEALGPMSQCRRIQNLQLACTQMELARNGMIVDGTWDCESGDPVICSSGTGGIGIGGG